MSASQILGAVAGVVVGAVAGPQAGFMTFSAVSGVGAYFDQPDRIGPRLEDLRIQMSQYGATIPFEWGTNRHAGTIIWPRVLEAVETRTEESVKGGPDNVSYSYALSCAVLVCEGPIAGIRRIWANKKIVYDISEDNGGATRDPAIGAIRFYLGTEDQEQDPLIEATDGAGPAYRGYAYVVFENYDVTALGGRPPQWEFEVITTGNTDIEPSSTFGEAYGLAGSGSVFGADIDSNGHIWLHTMEGHAIIDPITGQPAISATTAGMPQIQEYDAVTGELLWFHNVAPITEYGTPPVQTYPIKGKGICCGGYYFIGRGSAGWPGDDDEPSPYTHGLAVNIETRAVSSFADECSSHQFQNGFYWPSVPVPVIDNNKVYFASGNGLSSDVGVGFMPASIPGATILDPDFDPIPDRTGAEPIWSIPAGWRQARSKASCPPGPPYEFDGTKIVLPGWAYKSTLISNPDAVIVQGYGSSGNTSYVAFVAHSPIVDGFDLSEPTSVLTCDLPGDATTMPCVAWDPDNSTIWAFAGADGARSMLYAITPDAGGLTATYADFMFPAVPGQSQGADVKGMTLDTATGYLRLLLGGAFDNDVRMVLFDPITKTIISDVTIASHISATTGKLWDMPEHNKVVYANGYSMYSIPYAANLAPNAVQLSTIVADICERAGLVADDIDVTDLTDPVDGYIVPRQMTARAAIEPLQQAFFFDAVESDDKIKFVKRGSSVATTIPMDDRAAHEHGQSIPDAITITRAFELELPVQCDIEYPDFEADHLIGNQSDRRITKDTRHNLNLQLPVVMTAEKAKQVARTLLYEAWQNQTFRFATSRKYAYLEPTDIVELPTAAASYRGRIASKRELPNGVIEWEARVESVHVYTQTGEGSTPTGHPPQVIYEPGATLLALLDIPILRDADDNAGFYAALGGTTEAWNGAQLFKSTDSGSTYESILSTANEAAIGFAQTELPDFEGNIFDEGSSVTVFMTTGQTLTSATQDQVLNGANLAVIGAPGRWEVIQFKTATLVGANTYQLSGFLRGRRGTEWATGTHAAGDMFVLASIVTWNRVNAGDMGLSRMYKAPPYRTSLASATATAFTDTAVGLKPFAPVDAVGVRDGSNNLTLSWSRRSRLAAGTLHLPVALGEAAESYSIDIVVTGAVVRTITSSTQSATYSAADQTADGITPGNPITARIHMLSAVVGRGYPLEATV